MRIDLKDLEMFHWYEDDYGNRYECEGLRNNLPDEPLTYRVVHVNDVNDEFISYDYHPEYRHPDSHLYQAMLHFPWFYRLMYRRMKKRKEPKTFKHSYQLTTTWSGGQDVILAMVNSGDYTLREAIFIYTRACERCMNVLAYKYLNGKDGYAEGSNEWQKCNTVCDFCKDG